MKVRVRAKDFIIFRLGSVLYLTIASMRNIRIKLLVTPPTPAGKGHSPDMRRGKFKDCLVKVRFLSIKTCNDV